MARHKQERSLATVCGHDDCIYFRMRGDVFFCDYTYVTGYQRNCDICDCYRYNNRDEDQEDW